MAISPASRKPGRSRMTWARALDPRDLRSRRRIHRPGATRKEELLMTLHDRARAMASEQRVPTFRTVSAGRRARLPEPSCTSIQPCKRSPHLSPRSTA